MLKEGTILDDSINAAPSLTKYHTGERDPEREQTRKSNQRHFTMKLHIRLDDQSSLV